MFNAEQLARLTKAQIIGNGNRNAIIESISTDSRNITRVSDCLFVAIKGQHFNGHKYIDDVCKMGLKYFLVSEKPVLLPDDTVFLLVKDTLRALQKIAANHLSHYNLTKIGITGSNGKTIVKEWLFQLLQQNFSIVKSPKSYNSQLGVALSVLQTDVHHNLGIFEAGISEKGEMSYLQKIIKPDIGIFTNIGDAHAAGFSGIKEKIKEKLTLFKTVNTLIFCADHSMLSREIAAYFKDKKVKLLSWSLKDNKADISVFDIEKGRNGCKIKATFQGEIYEFVIPFSDPASVENAMHCFATGLALHLDAGTLKKRISQLLPIDMRLRQTAGINSTQIVHDYYNADLTSIEIAIDFMTRQQVYSKSTVILSDVEQNDLPPAKLYRKIAGMLKHRNCNRLIGIGENFTKMGFVFHTPEKHFFKTTNDFLDQLHTLEWNNETILLKGARKFGFERIARKLQEQKHQTYLEINLNNLEQNFNVMQKKLPTNTKMMVMVKAHAYGSGNIEVAKLMQHKHADYLAVAYPDEGVNLRKAGIVLPVMVLNSRAQDIDVLTDYHLEPVVYSIELLQELLKESGLKTLNKLKIHLEFDTGMHRLGFDASQVQQVVSLLKPSGSSVQVASVFSHLAASEDSGEKKFTLNQIKQFGQLATILGKELGYTPIRHIANSGAILHYPQAAFDMVRLGIGLYGVDPAGLNKELIPVGRLVSYISQIREVMPGDGVGYGRHSVSDKKRKIAVVAIGYADGVDRRLSQGKGYFIVNGKKAAITGNVCMDMTMVDVTGIECFEGDEAEVFGNNLHEIAALCNTIPYEILTGIPERVKRIFIHD